MSTINEQPNWENTVTEIDGSVGLLGGESGNFNLPIKQLANRTRYLKTRVDQLNSSAANLILQLNNLPPSDSVTLPSGITAPAAVSEGGVLVATVNLINNKGNNRLSFSLGGSATAGVDYDEPYFGDGVKSNGNGTLTVPAGIDKFQVYIPIKTDSVVDPNETIIINVDSKQATSTLTDVSTPTLVKTTYNLVPTGKIINADGSTNPTAVDNLVRGKTPGVHIDYYLEVVSTYSNGNVFRRTLYYNDAVWDFALPDGTYRASFTTTIITGGGPTPKLIFDYETWEGDINVKSGIGISTDHSYNMHDVTSRLSGITFIYATVSATLKSPNPNGITISTAEYGQVGGYGLDYPALY